MTLKGRGHDLDMFGAHYLDNGWRYSLVYNAAPKKYNFNGAKETS